MAHSWANNFKHFKEEEDFPSVQNITKFYEKLLATPKRVRGLRGLDQLVLKKFLNFVSGSDLVTFTKVNVSFTVPANECQRRPIVHTCGLLTQIPSTYNNFCELREDFSNILSHDRFDMDFI